MTNLDFLAADELPNGWAKVSLALFRQQTTSSFNPAAYGTSSFELYSVPSHETGRPEVVLGSTIGSNKQYVSPGDVLISKINPRLNRAWVVGNVTDYPKIASTEWIVFKQSNAIDSHLLCYILQSFRIRDFLSHNASGVGGSLTRAKPSLVDQISIGLPPVEEQHRIVVKIEELFSELDKGIESLKTAQAQLKVYRQALLKHAFEGKLTAQWRADNPDKLETADALLKRIQKEREQRYQQQVAEWEATGRKGIKPKPSKDIRAVTEEELNELPSLPPSWLYIRAEEICGFITKGTTPSKDLLFAGTGAVPFIKVYNLTKTGFLDFSIEPTFVREDTHNGFLARSKVYPNDVLMNIVGPPLGKVSIVPNTYSEWNINQAIAIYRSKQLSPKFLAAYLASEPAVRSMMKKSKATAGQFNLTLEICRDVPLPLCGKPEQEEIELLLEEKLSEVDQIEQTIVTTLVQSEALRQSILKKAFSGQLVPQDPTDEPASVLLARIKAEQSAAPKAKKARK